MKNLILFFVIPAVLFVACNNNIDHAEKTTGTNHSMPVHDKPDDVNSTAMKYNSNVGDHFRDMVNQYLVMKNSLAAGNGNAAATAGNAFVESMSRIDPASLQADKRKTWNDLTDDAKEMAEHIGRNAGNIEHQREHFVTLSNDMYDMVKAFGASQILYNYFCPRANNGKGATWLSELKEIKNPYLGNKMPACGSIKEEIK